MIDDQEDELQSSPDPESLRVQDFDVRNAVFVIPLDAPVPSELSEVTMPTGTLLTRLAALDMLEVPEFAFVPLSGTELLALDRAWRSMQRAKRVFALFELPGARYDVLFTQAVRQIGIQRVEWPAVSEALSSRVRTVQRTQDKTPWDMKAPIVPTSRRTPRSATAAFGEEQLPVPVSDEDQQ